MSATLTAYAAAKLVNQAFADAGVDKTIPAQMIYNYTKGRTAKGKVPFIAYDLKTGKIDPEVFQAWMVKYLAKQGIVHTVETVDVDDAYLVDVEN